ncbi:MAG: hypothetical protein V4760_13495, partial [Bdellovibrionota bacterium]
AFAHNGAHPDNPDAVNARGGIVKETKNHHVEVVPSAKSAKIYVFDRKMKAVAVEKIQMKARIATPKTSLNLILEPKGDHFDAPYPREPLMRYQIVVVLTDKKDEVVTFDVEPRKDPTKK